MFRSSRSILSFLFLSVLFSCLPELEKSSELGEQSVQTSEISTSLEEEDTSNTAGSRYGDLGSLLSGQVNSLSASSLDNAFDTNSLFASEAELESGLSGNVSDIFWEPRFSKPFRTSYLNELKGQSYDSYMCPPNSFMVGQNSLYHQDENGIEWSDRQYQMLCRYFVDGKGRPIKRESRDSCVTAIKTEKPENYKTEYSCSEGRFLSGHHSSFVANKKMRNHSFACCQIKHPDNLLTLFHQYEVYGLEHAGRQKNCHSVSDGTSAYRRNHWGYECTAGSLLNRIIITNVPETTKTSSYTTFDSKTEDPLYGYECCQAGVQQNPEDFIFAHPSQEEAALSELPYILYPRPEEE